MGSRIRESAVSHNVGSDGRFGWRQQKKIRSAAKRRLARGFAMGRVSLQHWKLSTPKSKQRQRLWTCESSALGSTISCVSPRQTFQRGGVSATATSCRLGISRLAVSRYLLADLRSRESSIGASASLSATQARPSGSFRVSAIGRVSFVHTGAQSRQLPRFST